MDQVKTLLTQMHQAWNKKKKDARNDFAKIYSSAYVACLEEIMGQLEQQEKKP